MDWTESQVAPDGTHHLWRGRALYAPRFLRVGPFRHPGLATVADESGAFHIHADGNAAYPVRFLRTFGFYEGLAAVSSAEGWFHIAPDGTPAYAARFVWCGNWQGFRCVVRGCDGNYFHLKPDGNPAYPECYSYVGDFREGAAVVEKTEGAATHIGPDGTFVHGKWFRGVDVFHKGIARARDEKGWFHLNRQGEALFERRFKELDQFYNEQARAERWDGGVEIIDHQGNCVVELLPSREDTGGSD